MMRGNRGEWTELYVLLHLISEGKLGQADTYLNEDPANVYEVISAFKFEKEYNLELSRSDQIDLYRLSDGRQRAFIKSIPIEKIADLSQRLLTEIKNGPGGTFPIQAVESDLANLGIQKLRAPSNQKADIRLKIYDHRLAKESELGFSVKSFLGKNSTLFNPGAGTNFIFQIDDAQKLDVSEFNRKTIVKPKIQSRIRELEKNGHNLNFHSVQSRQFGMNLKMLDGDLPDILAYALYYRFRDRISSVKDITQILEKEDPLNFYQGKQSPQKLYEYKMKRFLQEAAMGMTASTVWHGEYEQFGGVIFARPDGNVLCFHIYDLNLLRTYLIENTKFEQSSTGENVDNPGNPTKNGKKYWYGWVYEDNNELFLKLNLQIRFIRKNKSKTVKQGKLSL